MNLKYFNRYILIENYKKKKINDTLERGLERNCYKSEKFK